MFAGDTLYAVLSENALCESMFAKYDWLWGTDWYAFMSGDCWKWLLGCIVKPWACADLLCRPKVPGSMSCMVQQLSRTMTLIITSNLSIT